MKPLLLMSVLLLGCLLLSVAHAPGLSDTWQVAPKENNSLNETSGKDQRALPGYGAKMKNGGTFARKNCGVQPDALHTIFEEPEAYETKKLLENELLFERSIQNGLKRLLGIHRIKDQQLAVI